MSQGTATGSTGALAGSPRVATRGLWGAREAYVRWIIFAFGVVVVLAQWAHVIVRPRGDFNLHWEFGRRLVAGEMIYYGSLDCPYPPFWALAHAPLTVLPMPAAQVVTFWLFVVAIGVLLWVLDRLTQRHLPLDMRARFWVNTAAIFLASRFLIRDMLECGVNLALVALSWLAVWLWTKRREWLGGGVLGLAISLKCTPALFLAWFVWKRQWKMAAATSLAAAMFTLSPMLLMGPAAYGRAMQYWGTMALAGASDDPAHGVLGEEPLQNMSLRAALGRLLVTLPAGHQARVHHPLYIDLLNLPPHIAGAIVKGLMLLLLGAVAWRFRNRIEDRGEMRVYWECAAVSVLILLYSPITWGQHCVGVLPAFYLLSRTFACGGALPRRTWAVVGAYALVILVLNRSVLGQQLTWLIDSYRIPTWCLAGMLGLVVMHDSGRTSDECGGRGPLRRKAPLTRAA